MNNSRGWGRRQLVCWWKASAKSGHRKVSGGYDGAHNRRCVSCAVQRCSTLKHLLSYICRSAANTQPDADRLGWSGCALPTDTPPWPDSNQGVCGPEGTDRSAHQLISSSEPPALFALLMSNSSQPQGFPADVQQSKMTALTEMRKPFFGGAALRVKLLRQQLDQFCGLTTPPNKNSHPRVCALLDLWGQYLKTAASLKVIFKWLKFV